MNSTDTEGLKTQLIQEGKAIKSFGSARKKWAMWHLTSRCNIECRYCYGSFRGGSYKRNFSVGDDVPLSVMLKTADAIADLGFGYAHLNGGEPFLRADAWQIVKRLSDRGVKVTLLTNATFITKNFRENFAENWLDMLAFSLDSLRPEYGNSVREKTSVVLTNIEKIAGWREHLRLSTNLGLYVVLTRNNINLMPELLDWALAVGIDYINMQAVYLPKGHAFHDELSVTKEHHAEVVNVLERLRSLKEKIRTSSHVLMELTDSLILHSNLVAQSCFADQGYQLFISGTGNVYGCPSKPPASNPAWGNIKDTPLTEIVNNARQLESSSTICPHISLDCLGMYEMAYQER